MYKYQTKTEKCMYLSITFLLIFWKKLLMALCIWRTKPKYFIIDVNCLSKVEEAKYLKTSLLSTSVPPSLPVSSPLFPFTYPSYFPVSLPVSTFASSPALLSVCFHLFPLSLSISHFTSLSTSLSLYLSLSVCLSLSLSLSFLCLSLCLPFIPTQSVDSPHSERIQNVKTSLVLFPDQAHRNLKNK